MKKINIFLAFLLLGTTACTDLKEEVLDEVNGSAIVADSTNVEMLVAPTYAFLRDLQSRGAGWLAQETCTDEVVFPTRGANWNSADYRTIFTHDYTASNSYIKNTWNSYLIGFARCNVALFYMQKLPQTDKVKQYITEVRFIRTLTMYQLNDCFGQMPFRESSDYDYAKKPQYMNRAQIVERMISELNEIIPTMKVKGAVPPIAVKVMAIGFVYWHTVSAPLIVAVGSWLIVIRALPVIALLHWVELLSFTLMRK